MQILQPVSYEEQMRSIIENGAMRVICQTRAPQTSMVEAKVDPMAIMFSQTRTSKGFAGK